jgi:hypothetical protein
LAGESRERQREAERGREREREREGATTREEEKQGRVHRNICMTRVMKNSRTKGSMPLLYSLTGRRRMQQQRERKTTTTEEQARASVPGTSA